MEETDNNYFPSNPNIEVDSNMFSDGRFEILLENSPIPEIDDDGEIWTKKVVYTLNGAEVKFDEIDLKYRIHWAETGKTVSYVSFIMPRDEAKLSDIFHSMPYGLIMKNRTGVGATTLELKSKRNSIIVVPTKSLAHNKAIKSRIGDTNKYRVLYVGSPIQGFSCPSIDEYLSDNSIPIKKFIVVADSLPKLLEKIGRESFHNYFIMIDEIDTYQDDSSFRDSLEEVVDYYWLFPLHKRCMVSATMKGFSDRRIKNEPKIEIWFNEVQQRRIDLFNTDNVEIRTKKQIEQTLLLHPQEKILVAYNSIKGILNIINSLPESIRLICSILCSIKSQTTAGDYYHELIDSNLPTQVVFMTCNYFVGIDIDERFHLISVANPKITHTLLSTDKLQQIIGRCRHPEGVLSETIVYTTLDNRDNTIDNNIEGDLVEESELLCHFYKLGKELQAKYSDIYLDSLPDFVKLTEKHHYELTQKYSLVRQSFGNIVPAYFVIDNIIIQQHLLNSLYSSSDVLLNKLNKNNVVCFHLEEDADDNDNFAIARQETENTIIRTRESDIRQVIEELRGHPIDDRKNIAHQLRLTSSRHTTTFLEQFLELCDYIPFESLVEKLAQISSHSEYIHFYDRAIIWALSEDHPLKVAIREKFPANNETVLTSAEISQKVNDIWLGMWGLNKLRSAAALRKLDYFVKKSARTSIRINSIPINGYRIISYDPDSFGSTHEDVITLPSDCDVFNMFKSIR